MVLTSLSFSHPIPWNRLRINQSHLIIHILYIIVLYSDPNLHHIYASKRRKKVKNQIKVTPGKKSKKLLLIYRCLNVPTSPSLIGTILAANISADSTSLFIPGSLSFTATYSLSRISFQVELGVTYWATYDHLGLRSMNKQRNTIWTHIYSRETPWRYLTYYFKITDHKLLSSHSIVCWEHTRCEY